MKVLVVTIRWSEMWHQIVSLALWHRPTLAAPKWVDGAGGHRVGHHVEAPIARYHLFLAVSGVGGRRRWTRGQPSCGAPERGAICFWQ